MIRSGQPRGCPLWLITAENQLPIITNDALHGVARIDVTTAEGNGASLQKADGYVDADGDGQLSILDATVIQRFLVGFSTNPNIGQPI